MVARSHITRLGSKDITGSINCAMATAQPYSSCFVTSVETCESVRV